MSIDELINELENFKKNGISGETPVIVDCFDIPDGYRDVASVEATARNFDDLSDELLERSNSQYFPCITL